RSGSLASARVGVDEVVGGRRGDAGRYGVGGQFQLEHDTVGGVLTLHDTDITQVLQLCFIFQQLRHFVDVVGARGGKVLDDQSAKGYGDRHDAGSRHSAADLQVEVAFRNLDVRNFDYGFFRV